MALATQISNPGTQGQNARYDISGLESLGGGIYTDGVYKYDSNGLSLDRPDSWVDGLPLANDNGPGGISGGSGSGGGGGLAGMAMSSPWYQQVLAAVQASAAADAAARRSSIQQALIQFGLVPSNFTDQYGDVDDATRNLALQNTQSGVSVLARLQKALSDAQNQSSRGLAARGLRRSGARGYRMRQNQLSYDQNYSDSINKLLGGINETYRGFAQSEYGRQMSLAQALQSALSNFRVPSYTPYSSPSFPQSSPSPYYDSTPTYGGGQTQGGTGTAYGPASGTSSGGYTSPLKPILMPEDF